ncbi:MAG: hypothetical protein RR470_08340 [Vagococcus sp.]|uniref:hypothetical protein n=1 Tax=Vagococcus sp. TaxID=1933889 RepID=UPI002FC7DE31
MTTIYTKNYSETAKTLIISSVNSKDNGKSYVRFGAFCTAENQQEITNIVVSILKRIEQKIGFDSHFIVSYEFMSTGYKAEYERISNLIINFEDLEIETILLCVTNDTTTLIPFFMAVDEKTLINITYNFPIESVMWQIKNVYYSRFFKDLESIEKECAVNG